MEIRVLDSRSSGLGTSSLLPPPQGSCTLCQERDARLFLPLHAGLCRQWRQVPIFALGPVREVTFPLSTAVEVPRPSSLPWLICRLVCVWGGSLAAVVLGRVFAAAAPRDGDRELPALPRPRLVLVTQRGCSEASPGCQLQPALEGSDSGLSRVSCLGSHTRWGQGPLWPAAIP